jgi:RNA polymerase sigma-70 factor (ECF subfamily)
MSSLADSFRTALAPERRATITAGVAPALVTAIATARAAWPAIDVDDATFAAFLAERVRDGELVDAIGDAPAADLLLACGCVLGRPAAIAAFETVLAEVDAAGRSERSAADLVDEVKQRLRTLLLVADGKPPGIVGYRGRGSLRGWLRVAATRELVRMEIQGRRAAPLEDAVLDEPQGDPALEQLKARYRSELGQAIKDAIGRLSADDRTLLRHHLIDRLSIDQLGARYGVHRATAARWLSRARTALVAATETELAVRLRLAPDEVTSVIRMVASRLDASLGGALSEGDDDTRGA